MTKWKFRRKSSQNLPETYLYILKLCLMMPKNVGHFGFSTIVPSNIGICPIMPKTVGHNGSHKIMPRDFKLCPFFYLGQKNAQLTTMHDTAEAPRRKMRKSL